MGSQTDTAPTIVKWVLDTRRLWPEATQTKHLPTTASRAFALLPTEEQANVLRFYHVADAKLALGSSLLKRLAIARYASVPWPAASWSRDERTKPVFRHPDGTEPLLFNVSHQAGLVVLVALVFADRHRPSPDTSIGIDIVCPSERRDRDHAMIAADGWSHYVDMHSEVFSPAESSRLKDLPMPDADTRLAYFYALWCLREAYVKMTGEALLASWLRELELRYCAPPGQTAPEGRSLEIWFRGARVDDVEVQLHPLLDGYMVCTAMRWGRNHDGDGKPDTTVPFTELRIDELLTEAEAAGGL